MQFQLHPTYCQEKNIWEIQIQGEVDIYNSQTVKDVLTNLIAEHPCDIVIYCDHLEYIDSTALGALVVILKKVKSYDGTIHLVHLSPSVWKVFQITNLDKVFHIL